MANHSLIMEDGFAVAMGVWKHNRQVKGHGRNSGERW